MKRRHLLAQLEPQVVALGAKVGDLDDGLLEASEERAQRLLDGMGRLGGGGADRADGRQRGALLLGRESGLGRTGPIPVGSRAGGRSEVTLVHEPAPAALSGGQLAPLDQKPDLTGAEAADPGGLLDVEGAHGCPPASASAAVFLPSAPRPNMS